MRSHIKRLLTVFSTLTLLALGTTAMAASAPATSRPRDVAINGMVTRVTVSPMKDSRCMRPDSRKTCVRDHDAWALVTPMGNVYVLKTDRKDLKAMRTAEKSGDNWVTVDGAVVRKDGVYLLTVDSSRIQDL